MYFFREALKVGGVGIADERSSPAATMSQARQLSICFHHLFLSAPNPPKQMPLSDELRALLVHDAVKAPDQFLNFLDKEGMTSVAALGHLAAKELAVEKNIITLAVAGGSRTR